MIQGNRSGPKPVIKIVFGDSGDVNLGDRCVNQCNVFINVSLSFLLETYTKEKKTAQCNHYLNYPLLLLFGTIRKPDPCLAGDREHGNHTRGNQVNAVFSPWGAIAIV